MSVRMRHTRAHSANRRSHHKADSARKSKCEDCGVLKVRHQVCNNCGKYKGREVLDVTAAIAKKEAKLKARAEAQKNIEEEQARQAEKPLELARK